jgi:hypothetical protein
VDLAAEARFQNRAHSMKFRTSPGTTGTGQSYNYENDEGKRLLGDERHVEIQFGKKGSSSVYAYAYGSGRVVALATGCSSFDQIDDPLRWFESSNYYQPVEEGQIVIFGCEEGFALVRVKEVRQSCVEHGTSAEVRFDFELRLHPERLTPD